MERLGAGRNARRLVWRRCRRLRQTSLVLACLLLFAAVGVGAGWLVRGAASIRHDEQWRSAPRRAGRWRRRHFSAAGRAVGEVVVYSGSTSWLSMSLDDGLVGQGHCEVRLADGVDGPSGTFCGSTRVYGAWTVALPAGTGHIQLASVVTDEGCWRVPAFQRGTGPRPTRASDQAATVSGPGCNAR